MRTLKKTLCFVLALVMMLGLCAVSASATAFTDDNEIGADYKEAVEVVSAIGVINGKGDGSSFDPKGTLTRVQGSYLITYLLKADTGATATRFNDVNREDVGVVEWMAANKIADGRDDTTFDPSSTMTGKEFAKWLLTSLGYDAERENLTGPYWEGGVRILTAKIGLSRGIEDYDQNAPLTREEAAQMCLNALEQPMVEYAEGTLSGTTINVNLTYSPIANGTGKDYTGNENDDGIMQLCEMFYPRLTKAQNTDEDGVDAENLNRPMDHIWKLSGEVLYKVVSAPVAAFTGKTDAKDVTSALSGYYIVADDTKETEMTFNDTRTRTDNPKNLVIYVNGAEENTLNSTGEKKTFDVSTNAIDIESVTTSSMIAALTENGRVVELYATDKENPNEITQIVVNCFTVAKVDKVDDSTKGEIAYTFTKARENGSVSVTAKTYTDTPEENSLITDAALEKGAIVMLTSNGNTLGADKLYAYATEKHTGEQTRFTDKGKVTIDGTVYTVATGVSDGSSLLDQADEFDTNKEVDYYLFNLDNVGYLVHTVVVDKDESTGNYAFIVNASGKYNDGGFDPDEPVIKVRAVLSDGTWGDYTVATETIKANAASKRTDVYIADTQDGEYKKVGKASLDEYDYTVIKNTRILVVGGNQWTAASDETDNGEGTLSIHKSAQLLMGDLYGYVYEYSLNGSEITLKPLGDKNVYGDGGYGNNYAVNSKTKDKTYTGQTTTAVTKGVQSYKAASYATSGELESGIGKYGVPGASSYEGSQSDTVVIGSGTKFITYDESKKEVKVQTGLSNLPSASGDSNLGYYVAKASSATRLNADLVFITKNAEIKPDTVQSKNYIFIDTSKTQTTEEAGDNTKVYFTAWNTKGESVTAYAKAGTDAEGIETGLYYVKDSGEIGDKLLNNRNAGKDGDVTLSKDTPYFYVTKGNVSGGYIDSGDITPADGNSSAGNFLWSVGDVKSSNSPSDTLNDMGLFVILKVNSAGELTTDVDFIFTVKVP